MPKAEEEPVSLYASFSKTPLKQTVAIEEKEREAAEQLLPQLYRESARRRKMPDNLITQIEMSERNR